MKNQNYIYQNCKSARKARRINKVKRWSFNIIFIFMITASVMAINSYLSLIETLDGQSTTYSLISPVEAKESQIKPIQQTIEQQIRDIAKEHNFQWENYLIRLADCESKLNQFALNNNGKYGVDRGVFQINTKYHPEVSTECAMNIRCATEWTIDRINKGYQSEWMCDKIVNK
jgi:cell division protein FtsL